MGTGSWTDRITGFDDGVAVWLLRALAELASPVIMSEPVAGAVRAGVLVDLVLNRAAVLTSADEDRFSVEANTMSQPALPDPAALALASCQKRLPSKGLNWWLQRGRPPGRAVAEGLVARGEWSGWPFALGHYRPAATSADLHLCATLKAFYDDRARQPDPAVASLTIICAAVGVLGVQRRWSTLPGRLLAHSGAARVFLGAAADYLQASAPTGSFTYPQDETNL